MTAHLIDSASQQSLEPSRAPAPIRGWALSPLMQLDRAGARGLVADLMVAGPLTRQAAFTAAAAVLERGVEAVGELFVERIGVGGKNPEHADRGLRRHRAREMIAALYDVPAQTVPKGYLRALLRVQESGSEHLGQDPFAAPESYASLFRIMAGEHAAAKHSLRYCGALRSSHVQAVQVLPSPFLVPEVVRSLSSPERVRRAIALPDILRARLANLDDDILAAAVRQSLGSGDVLGRMARRLLEQADRLPVPALPPLDELRPLTTADEVRTFGVAMDNCASTLISEISLGLKAVCAYRHTDDAGAETPLAILLTPLATGSWEVSQIVGRNNAQVARPVLRTVLRRLMSIGVQVAGPALGGAYHQGVAELLGHYCYDPFAGVLHEASADEVTTEEDACADLARIATRLDRITLAA